FSVDIKEAVRVLTNSPLAPAFPPSLWKFVLLDQFVDFDLILSNTYSTEPEEHHHLWINAFWVWYNAVTFAFQGRQAELQVYWKHINGLFNSRNPAFHGRVIAYDRATRLEVGKTRSLIYNSIDRLQECRDAHLLDGGLHVVPVSLPSGRSGPKPRGGKPQQRRDIDLMFIRFWQVRSRQEIELLQQRVSSRGLENT
ncbi:hypothetical protein GGX14DRAFT_348534, partial [Mycena pura]